MKWIYKKEIIPAIVVFLIIAVIALFYNENEAKLYKQKGAFTSALVTGFEYDYRGRLELKYEFRINNSKVRGSTSFPELKGGAEQYIVGHYLPVIYLKDNLEKNELLASPKKFSNLLLKRPDSIAWLDKLERTW